MAAKREDRGFGGGTGTHKSGGFWAFEAADVVIRGSEEMGLVYERPI